MNRRRLLIGLIVALVLSVGVGASVLPSSADGGLATVTLASGKTLAIPAAVPCSATPIPPQTEPIVSVTCPPEQPAVVTTPTPTPTPTTPTTTPTTATPAPTPKPTPEPKPTPKPNPKPQPKPEPGDDLAIGGKQVEDAKPAPERASQTPVQTTPATPATPTTPAAGTAGNEIFGSAPVGVPNFFIEKFRIPPFLLGIYQAAGIEYGIPWQVLAAINEIETDYGRNLNVSSAGALGWMQFIPSSWQAYGVDANGDGRKDPYNPVDAIFAAGRYLKAAGGSTDLRKAIFAYNHADWYVDSVMLRARLIGGLPADLVGALTGLTSGRFPVAARSRYADGLTAADARKRVKQGNAAQPVESKADRTSIDIFAKAGSPVIAVQDGIVRKVGESKELGRFVVLEDVYGNAYTYSHLGKVAASYPSPKAKPVSASQVKTELAVPKDDPKPKGAASAGAQPSPAPTAAAAKSRKRAAAKPVARPTIAVAKERLFAHPVRPRSRSNGGEQQLVAFGKPVAGYQTYDAYFKQVLGLKPDEVELKPLTAGAQIIGGTVLGRIDKVEAKDRAHLTFQIRPVGRGAPLIDPKPILDGWRLLASTAIYRAQGDNPFFGNGAKNPTIGQILLMSKEALERRVLADPSIDIYECGRRDIRSGQIDRRVLGTLAYLSSSGLKLTLSSLKCGHSYYSKAGTVSEHSSGNAVDIAAVNGIPIYGHQGKGTITDITIRRLLNLQGTMKPHQIISLMKYEGTDNTLVLSDHDDHIHLGFYPRFSDQGKLGTQANAVLKPGQWTKLIDRLSQIDNPTVAVKPSKYSIKVTAADGAKSGSGE